MESELPACFYPKITPEDWRLTLVNVQQVVMQLLERVAVLEEEVSGWRGENE